MIFKFVENYNLHKITKQDRIIKDLFTISNNQKVTKINDGFYIIDNFYKNPDMIRKFAISNNNNFNDHKAIYLTRSLNPFLYSDVAYQIIDNLERVIWKDINRKDWDIDVELHSNGFIQYITKDMKPAIHHDNHWGGVVFLTPNPVKKSGTSIFKHKATGNKEFLSNQEIIKKYGKNKLRDYLRSYQPDLWQGDEEPKFDKWERLYQCDNVYNRAIFFNGRQWHCSDGGFGDNIKNARLFQTFFFSPFK
jgi:hypothetical protein